ncbi:MAG: hypothetical protein AB1679_00240 [Actinomycetota bacterium]
MFGQLHLFGSPPTGPHAVALRFRVSAPGRRQPATASLALAVARARAAAMAGHRAVILGSDGTVAVVRPAPNGGFVVIGHGPGSWPDQCRRLLDAHG